MKSLPKVNPNDSLPTWNPSELDAKLVVSSQSVRKERVLAIFKKEEEEAEKPALHTKETGKNFKSWQPRLLSEKVEVGNLDEWTFIEVSDTPFDKSWKKQAPNGFPAGLTQQERFISESENETPLILERARLQAEEIILAAQAEADDVLLQAQTEIDEQKKEGYQQGRNEARAEVEDAVNAVQKMVGEVEIWQADFVSQSEQILIEMLKDISRKMFGDGAKLDSQTLHTNLNRIMENAHGLGALKIFLNPNDVKMLDSSWSEQQMLIMGEQVKIVPSVNVLPGGCLLKGNIGTVDARVETQLDSILKTFDGLDTPAG
jgi:flagellar biosynthesis/type III secretory pathway protein FliH